MVRAREKKVARGGSEAAGRKNMRLISLLTTSYFMILVTDIDTSFIVFL